jgi:PAS domain S-box-containing protein
MHDQGLRILLIEDNPGDARLIKEMLREAGTPEMAMEWERHLSSGLARLRQNGISAVLLDLDLPDASGLETLAKVYSQFPEIPIVVLTGQGDEAVAAHAVRRGAQDFLVKGAVDDVLLVRSIRYAIERKQLEVDLVKAREELEKRVEERTSELLLTNKQLQREIAQRKRAAEALKQSEERFRAIFEGAQDLIFLKDLSLRYTDVNPAMEKLLGMAAAQIVGKTADDLFDTKSASYIRDVDTRVLQGEWIDEVYTKNINGVPMTLHEVRVPMRDGTGKIIGLCGISRDVTDRSRREVAPLTGDREYPSEAMREVLRRARYAAAGDSVILLTGESGAGKDHLARYIHEHSKRASGPYSSINCAAVAPELAESELFGHERGAFTGAHGRKRGLLELAEGGTLLLNEIGELPLPLQAKLLTFLDTRQITRVGGEKTISVHARLIAATNRDLEKEVKEKRFRQDLFYRLNVINVVVPPLRERREDVPIIAEEVISKLAIEMQLTHVPIIGGQTLLAIQRYHWPGNVRELRNALERALILWDGEHFDLNLPIPQGHSREWSHTVSFPTERGLRDVIEEVTQSLCLEALRRCRGNKKETACLLGIARDSLYRYLKQFGIESES